MSPVVVQNYLDFPAKSQFVGFYIASSKRTYDICMKLSDSVQAAIENLRVREKVTAGDAGGINTLDDPRLIDAMKDRNICLTACPTWRM